MFVPLTDEVEARIHEASLKVLADTGVWFRDCPEAIDLLEGHGCAVDGYRVRFPKSLVEECLTQLPDRNSVTVWLGSLRDRLTVRQGESHVLLVGNAYYTYDYEAKIARDCDKADIDRKFLVLDHLRNIEGDNCILLLERTNWQPVATYDTVESCMAFLHRRVRHQASVRDDPIAGRHDLPLHGGMGWNEEETRLARLAHMIVAGPEATEKMLTRANQAFVWCNPVSPLQYHPDEARKIISVARDTSRPRVVLLAPEIMMGATGPVTVGGTLVQHNAEVLAGTVLAQLAGPNTTVIYGCVSAVMDLRVAEVSLGSFETGLIHAACVQMANRYGMPSRIAPGNSSARQHGPRAAVEQVLGLYMGLAAGGNLITTGLLDSTLMLSLEHLILLDELVPHIRSIVGDIKLDEYSLAVGEIWKHGHPSPDFITSDYTVQNMKKDIYYSDFCGRTAKSYEDWYEKAHQKVQEILKMGDEYQVDKCTLVKLDAVEALLKKDNLTWREDRPDWWLPYARVLA